MAAFRGIDHRGAQHAVARVGIGAVIEQHADDGGMTFECRGDERRFLLEVLQIDVGALGNEQLDHVGLALAREYHERGVATAIARVRRGAFLQYTPHRHDIVVSRRNKQLCVQSQVGSRLRICTGLHNQRLIQ